MVGTISLVVDTSLGLSADNIADLSKYRSKGARLAEISGLAVKKSERKKGNVTFMSLAIECVNYSKFIVGCEFLVSVINRKAEFLYSDIFLFNKLSKTKQEYDLVNDSNAISMILDARSYLEKFKSVYGKMDEERNLYKAIVNPCWKYCVQKEKFDYFLISKNEKKLNSILNIFSEKGQVLENCLSRNELSIVKAFYLKNPKTDFASSLSYLSKRESLRIYTNMPASFSIFGDSQTRGDCQQVSHSGMCLKIPCIINVGEEVSVSVKLGPDRSIQVRGKVVWSLNSKVGIKIIKNKESWEKSYLSILKLFEGRDVFEKEIAA